MRWVRGKGASGEGTGVRGGRRGQWGRDKGGSGEDLKARGLKISKQPYLSDPCIRYPIKVLPSPPASSTRAYECCVCVCVHARLRARARDIQKTHRRHTNEIQKTPKRHKHQRHTNDIQKTPKRHTKERCRTIPLDNKFGPRQHARASQAFICLQPRLDNLPQGVQCRVYGVRCRV